MSRPSWAGRVNIKPGSDSRESVTVHWCSCLYCFQRASSNNWMQYARRMSTPAQEKNKHFASVAFMIASPVDADGGSCCPCASGSGCRELAPVGTEIGCRVVPPRDSYPACRNVGQAHRGLSVFSLKIACVCSVRRRPVFSVVRDVAVASKTPSGTGKEAAVPS